MPAVGGAERFVLEALAAIRERHSVRTIYLAPEHSSRALLGVAAAPSRRGRTPSRAGAGRAPRGRRRDATALGAGRDRRGSGCRRSERPVAASYESLCRLALRRRKRLSPGDPMPRVPGAVSTCRFRSEPSSRARGTSTTRCSKRPRRSWLRADTSPMRASPGLAAEPWWCPRSVRRQETPTRAPTVRSSLLPRDGTGTREPSLPRGAQQGALSGGRPAARPGASRCGNPRRPVAVARAFLAGRLRGHGGGSADHRERDGWTGGARAGRAARRGFPEPERVANCDRRATAAGALAGCKGARAHRGEIGAAARSTTALRGSSARRCPLRPASTSSTIRLIVTTNRSARNRSALARHRSEEPSSETAIRLTAFAIDLASARSRRTPVSPSRTMSSAPPVRGAITGVPQACASTMAIPNSSTRGRRRRSHCGRARAAGRPRRRR